LVARARAAATGVAAFNVITLEHAEGIVAAAVERDRPVILQISQNAVGFHGVLAPIATACAALGAASPAEVALHLDHVEDVELLHEAPATGFSSVMFDAGARAYADNLAATTSAVEWAHGAGRWIEAELGYVGGKPDAPRSAHAAGVRTDPAEAREFVAVTGVDALAVAVGSSHAMTTRAARLDHELIAALRAAVPVPLVLHGSSGVPDDELRAAIRAGITKVNVGTALNVAFTAAVRAALLAGPELVDPRRYLSAARDAITAVVAERLDVISG
jgi:fructose-bisphosphate aldolase class II